MNTDNLLDEIKSTKDNLLEEAKEISSNAIKKTKNMAESVSNEVKELSEKFEDKLMPKMSEKEVETVLEAIYGKVVNGIPKVDKPINVLCNDYLKKYKDPDLAIKELTKYQLIKCSTSGFITGLGGLITLPVAIPANITTVWYVQIRMAAAIAYLSDMDITSDQVQTLVFACLTGKGITEIIKQAGIKAGNKFANGLIQLIPTSVIKAINKKVQFRLLTKFGEKGIINLGKLVPVVGGVIGGTFDLIETKIVANSAYKLFKKGEIPEYKNTTEDKLDLNEVEDFVDIIVDEEPSF